MGEYMTVYGILFLFLQIPDTKGKILDSKEGDGFLGNNGQGKHCSEQLTGKLRTV